MKYHYQTQNTCAYGISFDMDNGVVTNIQFEGGCNGNLKAIATLLEGTTATYIISKLSGNTCGRRSTSCADQLAQALKKALSEPDSAQKC